MIQRLRTRACLIAVVVLGIAVCGIAPALFADDITFTATVDKDKVALDDRLVLSLSIVGARNATEPQLPRMDAFKIVSSGTTSQFNFMQGRMSASRSFTYVLMPQKVGTFTIEPARWEHDGRQYTTEPITVEVVDAGVATGPVGPAASVPTARAVPQEGQPVGQGQIDLGDRLFIQVKVDKEEVYLNEQVIVMFRLYRKNLNLDDLQYTPPPTTGFIEESLGKQKETREWINGILYDVIELKTALFPASTGDLTIGPASLKCNILVRSRRQRAEEEGMFGGLFNEPFFGDNFLDRLAKYPVELKSKPVTIRVNPLPAENKPPDFHGAVGDYQMEAWAKPSKLKVGEPVSLTMKVVGTGNIPSLPAPVMDKVEGFKGYDSESKVNLQERIDVIGGEKVFEKVLIPQKAGKLKIPPVRFSFFNPRSARYETLSEGPFWLDVEESAEGRSSVIVSPAGVGAAKEDVQIIKRDILFIKEQAGAMHRSAQDLTRRGYFWWAQVLPLLLLLGTIALQRRSDRLGSDIKLQRFRKALTQAQAGLRSAEKLIGSSDEAKFHQALTKALNDYLSNRWNLFSGEITPQDVSRVLVPQGLRPELADRTRAIIERIDQGRFARTAGNAQDLRQLFSETSALIKDMERSTR